MIRSVGLAPTKSKNLVACSKKILERFDGKVPGSVEELTSLPGVGPKTAAVVMAQAFGVASFPVDTHIHRLSLRWGLTADEKRPDKVSEDLKRRFPRSTWSKLHLQMIYFGREHCPAKDHSPQLCPICDWIRKGQAVSSPGEPSFPRLRKSLFYCPATPSPTASCFSHHNPGATAPMSPVPASAIGGNGSPKKTNTPTKHKGIIFYSERLGEVTQDPLLGACLWK